MPVYTSRGLHDDDHSPAPVRRTRFTRLGAWSRRHHWTAIIGWLLVLGAVTAGAAAAGDDYRNDFSLPGTQSQQLVDLYAEHAPAQQGDSITVVVQATGGLDGVTARVDELVDDLGGLDHVAAVQRPDVEAGSVSDDGTLGLATVVLDDQAGEVPTGSKIAIIDTATSYASADLRVELTGDAVREVEESEAGGGAEGAGVLAALVILLFLFGSLLAASLPIITAVFAVGTTVGVVALASHLTTVPDYTPPVLILVGLGVGIDYALLVFARFRSELLGGATREQAADTALDTAGRSVLFAGATVVIALLGLYTLGLGSLEGVALAVTLTVLMTMLASLTLLPSLVTIFGRRLERSVRRRGAKQAAPRSRAGTPLAGLGRRRAPASAARAPGRGRGPRRPVRAGVRHAPRARRRRQRPPHAPPAARPTT